MDSRRRRNLRCAAPQTWSRALSHCIAVSIRVHAQYALLPALLLSLVATLLAGWCRRKTVCSRIHVAEWLGDIDLPNHAGTGAAQSHASAGAHSACLHAVCKCNAAAIQHAGWWHTRRTLLSSCGGRRPVCICGASDRLPSSDRFVCGLHAPYFRRHRSCGGRRLLRRCSKDGIARWRKERERFGAVAASRACV